MIGSIGRCAIPLGIVLLACAPRPSRVPRDEIPAPRWGASITQPRVEMDTVRLADGPDSITAYLARPRGGGRHPAVVVIHANRLTEPYIASTTAMLAEAGFVALAVDVFHFLPGNASWTDARKTSGDSVSAALARGFRERRLVGNVQAGIDFLRRQPNVAPGGVALLGFCGGGWNALLVAAQSADVGAVVAFYAPVAQSDAQHRAPLDVTSYIRVPVLYQRATADPYVTLSEVERFESALKAQGTAIERVDYDATHGFFAWNRETVFSPTEAARAWQRTVEFLRTYAGRPVQSRPLAPVRASSSVRRVGSPAAMHLLH
jgi:carboxymethylenebutenolidase